MASKKKKVKNDAVPNKAALPGMEDVLPKRYPALDKLCENLIAAQASVSKARTKKNEVHAQLDKGMEEREISSYFHEDSGKDFILNTKKNITFKNRKKNEDSSTPAANAINPGAPMGDVELDEDDDAE